MDKAALSDEFIKNRLLFDSIRVALCTHLSQQKTAAENCKNSITTNYMFYFC